MSLTHYRRCFRNLLYERFQFPSSLSASYFLSSVMCAASFLFLLSRYIYLKQKLKCVDSRHSAYRHGAVSVQQTVAVLTGDLCHALASRDEAGMCTGRVTSLLLRESRVSKRIGVYAWRQATAGAAPTSSFRAKRRLPSSSFSFFFFIIPRVD